jgi:Flp pilus assembly protein TadD
LPLSALTYLSQRASGSVSDLGLVSLGSRVQNAIVSTVAYLRQMILPTDLVAFYPYRDPLPVATVFASLAVLLVLTATVVAIRRGHPSAAVGWFWYLVTLTPVVGIVQVGSHAMADRFTYVPLIGIFVAVAWTGGDLLRRWNATASGRVAAVTIVLLCSWLTRQQVHVWRNSTSLWEHAIRVTPDNYRAHANLGVVLANQGRLENAIAEYTTALRLNPNQPKAENNLGLALAASGDKAAALTHYTAAIRLDPDYTHAHQNLGVLLVELGRFDDAVVHGREAIRLNPGYAEAHMMLAIALASRGQVDEAIPHALEAVRLAPSSADARRLLAELRK